MSYPILLFYRWHTPLQNYCFYHIPMCIIMLYADQHLVDCNAPAFHNAICNCNWAFFVSYKKISNKHHRTTFSSFMISCNRHARWSSNLIVKKTNKLIMYMLCICYVHRIVHLTEKMKIKYFHWLLLLSLCKESKC